MTSNSRALAPPTGKIIAALDVGSSKIGCLIIESIAPPNIPFAPGNTRVLGVGYQRSRGIKGGLVFDSNAVETAIRAAVDKAERQAGITIDNVFISMNAGRIRSQNYGAVLDLSGASVKPVHVKALLRKGWDHVVGSSDAILHAQPIGYALDGVGGIESPIGYSGQRLFADFHVISADLQPVRALLSCVEDSYLSPISVVAAPYASALATLRSKEAREGVAVLDLGGGTSSLAVFSNQQLIFANSIAKGGISISAALARSFNMSWADAERLKLHIGSHPKHKEAYPTGSDLINRQLMGIFLHQKQKMIDAGFAFDAVRYIVLTGGGARYNEACAMAAQVFGKPARVGVPHAVSGLPPQLVNPAFSALCGIVSYQNIARNELATRFSSSSGAVAEGALSKIGDWFLRLGS